MGFHGNGIERLLRYGYFTRDVDGDRGYLGNAKSMRCLANHAKTINDRMLLSFMNSIMSIEYRGEKFEGYNKPKKTPKHPTKSHAVLAKDGDQVKLIRFGEQGVTGSPKKPDESEKSKDRREAFKARHAENIKKGKMSAAYWANKVKW